MQLVEETVFTEEMRCEHSYDQRCHTSYVTNYKPQQEEECKENFRKTCFIHYEQVAGGDRVQRVYHCLPSFQLAFNETVEICRESLVKDCNIQGPEICRTEFESECWTKQEEHEVEEDVVECRTEMEEKCEEESFGYTTNTKCSQWPREVCRVNKQSVKKFRPVTSCTKEPRQLCAPAGCGFSKVQCEISRALVLI